ncbi:NCK-interacting with SH3 domain [Labeo rohita]|uniref:NCK-interacting with SH3 domain n=1 Tax=Labeo rohita TaxID=84645 RepID=A0A498P4V7_LABRO|nr:NCK-interacting with SH3 domain [Labeo rohita]
MCGLDAALISTLLNSVLTMELARDLQTDTQEHEKMCYSALLMAMIFSTGEQIPLHHYEHLNPTFLQFLLDVIEDGLPSDATEQLPDLFINLLLAFNLHLSVPESNMVMQALIKRHNVKILTEKLLLLLNRGGETHTHTHTHTLISQQSCCSDVLTLCVCVCRGSSVCVRSRSSCAALGAQVPAGRVCESRHGRHLLPH